MSILKMNKNDPEINKLCLVDFGCSDTEAIVLGYVLEVNTVLTSVDMSYNPGIGITGAKYLANAIIKNKRIKIFGRIPVYNLITNDPKLKELFLVGNGCGITEAILVGLLLNINSTVSKINMNGEIMLGAFRNDRTKNLNLSMRGYKDIDAIIIAALLKRNSTITKLFLVGNNIGNIGAQAIAEELSVNRTLKELYMSCNQIGDLGAKAIGEALKTNKALNKLWLFSNEIADSGADALVEGLEKNKTLQKIYLSQNKFSQKGKRALRDADNLSTRSIIINTCSEASISENKKKKTCIKKIIIKEKRASFERKTKTNKLE